MSFIADVELEHYRKPLNIEQELKESNETFGDFLISWLEADNSIWVNLRNLSKFAIDTYFVHES